MTTEQAVVPGRETFGEPKKIADIEFSCEADRVHSSVSRLGMKYLEVSGQLGEELGARSFVEYGFCYKAMPSCDANLDFDADPLLVRLEWQHEQTSVRKVENAELVVSESPMDPVADLPVRRLLSCEYEVGTTQSNGQVLRSIPGDWLIPFLSQRYDDMSGEGMDIEVAG